ncbi:MAG: hypothetical protein II233_04585, partial [Clostridia bacterium]|nr:hypothetical protein [Clostridia bacterium]
AEYTKFATISNIEEETTENIEETTVEATEEAIAETDTQTDSEPVAMGGSFGFGGNEALDEEYAPVEKEPIVLENVPLGGSFGFEAEDTKVATISSIEEETTENVEETAEEPVAEADTNTDSEPVAMGGSFGFGGNEALDEEYAPVEKEPIVLENVPLGGSFGFETEDTKVATISSIEEETTESVEKPTVRTPIEIATEDSNEPDDMIVSFKK